MCPPCSTSRAHQHRSRFAQGIEPPGGVTLTGRVRDVLIQDVVAALGLAAGRGPSRRGCTGSLCVRHQQRQDGRPRHRRQTRIGFGANGNPSSTGRPTGVCVSRPGLRRRRLPGQWPSWLKPGIRLAPRRAGSGSGWGGVLENSCLRWRHAVRIARRTEAIHRGRSGLLMLIPES